MEIKRTEQEVDEAVNQACENNDAGRSSWPGMSYEDGVAAALLWITGQSDDNPMIDE